MVPAPGTYTPNETVTRRAGPMISMGARTVTETKKMAIPGPGTYVSSLEKVRLAAPSFGFGSSKRPDISGKKGKFMTPGPGSYTVPSTIADVPAYAMPSRNVSP